MPHIILERSSNVKATKSSKVLFRTIFEIINQTVGIDVANCKGRVRIADDFYVGSCSSDEAFVHLEFKLIEGRDSDVKRLCGEKLLEFLKGAFATAERPSKLQLTVEISEATRELYFKHSAS